MTARTITCAYLAYGTATVGAIVALTVLAQRLSDSRRPG